MSGDKVNDRIMFIMDRSLNSCESDTLQQMFREMPGNQAYFLKKGILAAIDKYCQTNTDYPKWNYGMSTYDSGMTDHDIYYAMSGGVGYLDSADIYSWEANATASQMAAVAKLVRCGGWANTTWSNSGLNNG